MDYFSKLFTDIVVPTIYLQTEEWCKEPQLITGAIDSTKFYIYYAFSYICMYLMTIIN